MPKKASTKTVKKAAAKPVAKKTIAAPKAVAKPIKAAAKPAKEIKPAKVAAKSAKPAPAPVKPAKAPKVAAKPVAKKAPKAAVKPVVKAPAKASKTGPKKGRGRVTSASGPLSNAVVAVLKRVKRPMSCAEITDALIKKNYQFTHPEPKRIVSIRIYKLKGVKQTGPGRFTAEQAA